MNQKRLLKLLSKKVGTYIVMVIIMTFGQMVLKKNRFLDIEKSMNY